VSFWADFAPIVICTRYAVGVWSTKEHEMSEQRETANTDMYQAIPRFGGGYSNPTFVVVPPSGGWERIRKKQFTTTSGLLYRLGQGGDESGVHLVKRLA
jgi:hypothetical protein